MTPDDLLTACREAWPETETGRWEDYSYGDDPENLWATRNVGRDITVNVRHDRGTASVGDWRPRFECRGTPAEVVTSLRAWCREQARALAEEVDPPTAPG